MPEPEKLYDTKTLIQTHQADKEFVKHMISLFLEHIQETKDVKDSFYNFWTKHPKTPLFPFAGTAIEPYKNNIPRVPHICIKVPTAGGKTFIACNAIKTIFDQRQRRQTVSERICYPDFDAGGSLSTPKFVT